MSLIIQADEHGAITLPPGTAGITPGGRYAVEEHGESVVLHPEKSEADIWFETHTAEERVAWLHEWTSSLPASPALSNEAVSRDSMYE